MISARRISVTPRPHWDRNIKRQYQIQDAAWVWHPEVRGNEVAVLMFRTSFTTRRKTKAIFHVSADNRYELYLDGEFLSMGPDRSDTTHWAFASYEVELAPGRHRLEALAWHLGGRAPWAQESLRGGFIFAAAGKLGATLNTGLGNWQVRRCRGFEFTPPSRLAAFVISGPEQRTDGRAGGASQKWVAPKVVERPLKPKAPFGDVACGWKLFPSCLPDQLRRPLVCGTVRAVKHGAAARYSAADCRAAAIADWQAVVDGKRGVSVPARSTLSVLWDLEDYHCAYPLLALSAGKGAELKIEWAESLFEREASSQSKGNRDAVAGKLFRGMGDSYLSSGAKGQAFRPLWWRAGRYVRLQIKTAAQPLSVDGLGLLECRYPLENEGVFRSSHPGVDGIIPLAVRGMQMCAHEHYMDCPYYEQMMYVGDTRVEMLVDHVLCRDDRLVRRGIELFDWSRWRTGLVAERYPSLVPQQSPTYAMIWILMLADYALWRDDPAWVRERMTGVRAMLEEFIALLGDAPLLSGLPGWQFMDWVPAWEWGNAPGSLDGVSAVVNLLFINCLLAAAALETAHGEQALAARYSQLAKQLMRAVCKEFWTPSRGLFADDATQKSFSEHAQCLALLTGLMEKSKQGRCFQALLSDKRLGRATVYFSFYLFETLYRHGRGDLLIEKLHLWHDYLKLGMRTPLESPGDARSDCHAWGSHPLFHFHASLAGIRPAAPGFRSVLIEPCPGKLGEIHSKLPHPRGFVEADMYFDARGGCRAVLSLPPGTPGTFRWRGKDYMLKPGESREIIAGARR